MKIFLAVKSIIFWTKSLYYFDRGEYEQAYEELSSIRGIPERKRIPEYMLKGLIKYILGGWEESKNYMDIALKLIKLHHTMDDTNKRYLSAYCNHLKNENLKESADYSVDEGSLIEINYQEIDLDEVKYRYKKNFPLRKHPGWSELKK